MQPVDELITIELDLEEMKKNDRLNESWLRMFGTTIEIMLSQMFGWQTIASLGGIRGKPDDVKAFAKAIGSEKKYIEAAKKHGLTDPKTYKVKSSLERAVGSFEKVTGLKWPFKG
jgi:hypothetical protein